MKKTTIIIIFLLTFIISFADIITIKGDSWMPHNGQPNSDKIGYMMEIAKYILEKNGHTVKYEIAPWSRALKEVRKGTIDAVVGASLEDIEGLILPANEEGLMISEFYVMKGKNWKYTGIESLDKISFGVVQDYTYGNEVDGYIEKNKENSKKIQIVSGDGALENNIKKLELDRIDAILEDRFVVRHNIEGKENIVPAGNLKPIKLYIAFSEKKPKSKEYAQIISDGVEEMRKNGKLKEILKKYGLEDWK